MTFARRIYVPEPRAPLRPATRRASYSGSGAQIVTIDKGVQAKPGKSAPNAAERRWMDAIVAHGCIACRLDGMAPRPTCVHHILRGGQRMGHLFTLPLCDPGHHQGGQEAGLISRHPWKARFEQRYGTEADLLTRVQLAIGPF